MVDWRRYRGGGIGMILLLLVFSGCGEDAAEMQQTGTDEQRIVCLSPAITQMLIDLKVADRMVGRAAYDDLADQDLPVVGDQQRLEVETLVRVNPSEVLIQSGQAGVPAALAEVAEQKGWSVHDYRIQTIADVLNVLAGDGGVGSVVGKASEAEAIAKRIESELTHLRESVAGKARPRTLLLVGTNPMMAAGPETFLGELLTIAGGAHVLDAGAGGYPSFDREGVHALNPELIIVVAYTPEAVIPSGAALGAPAGTRIEILRDPAALKPSTTLVRTARALHALLFPDKANGS